MLMYKILGLRIFENNEIKEIKDTFVNFSIYFHKFLYFDHFVQFVICNFNYIMR